MQEAVTICITSGKHHSLKENFVDCKIARWGITLIVAGFAAFMALTFNFIPASAGASFTAPLCGDGSAPDYGFSYGLQQAHWTVDWENYVSEQTVTEVDTILDQLNGDSIAQTMILIKPQDQVGNRVNCAVHFLRYMQLGLPTGERKDNGFVFLIVVEPTRIDVHYGVGLGLPALTASELTNLNRAAEDTYQSTHSMDQALLTLVQEFDKVARNNYSPLVSPTTTPETIDLPALPSGPMGIVTLCCLCCLGILLLLFLMWLLPKLARSGINFYPSGGFGSGGFGGFSGGRGGGGSSSRSGSGSGRSGRGN
jgi:hypothetical protein